MDQARFLECFNRSYESLKNKPLDEIARSFKKILESISDLLYQDAIQSDSPDFYFKMWLLVQTPIVVTKPVPDPTFTSFAANDGKVYVNPVFINAIAEYISSQAIKEDEETLTKQAQAIAYILTHEMSHIILKHVWKGQEIIKKLLSKKEIPPEALRATANVIMDYIINTNICTPLYEKAKDYLPGILNLEELKKWFEMQPFFDKKLISHLDYMNSHEPLHYKTWEEIFYEVIQFIDREKAQNHFSQQKQNVIVISIEEENENEGKNNDNQECDVSCQETQEQKIGKGMGKGTTGETGKTGEIEKETGKQEQKTAGSPTEETEEKTKKETKDSKNPDSESSNRTDSKGSDRTTGNEATEETETGIETENQTGSSTDNKTSKIRIRVYDAHGRVYEFDEKDIKEVQKGFLEKSEKEKDSQASQENKLDSLKEELDSLKEELESLASNFIREMKKAGFEKGGAYRECIGNLKVQVSSLKEKLLSLITTKIDGQKVLSTWIKPNRKFPGIIPAIKRLDKKRLIVFMDVSGSISDQELNVTVSLLKSLLKNKKIVSEIIVLPFDVGIQARKETTSTKLKDVGYPLKKESDFERVMKAVKGGGGTELTPAIEFALKFKDGIDRDSFVMVITDSAISDDLSKFARAANEIVKRTGSKIFWMHLRTGAQRFLDSIVNAVGENKIYPVIVDFNQDTVILHKAQRNSRITTNLRR